MNYKNINENLIYEHEIEKYTFFAARHDGDGGTGSEGGNSLGVDHNRSANKETGEGDSGVYQLRFKV